MPLTQLDPAVALVVIDLQAGIAALPCVHPFDPVVANASALAAAFRRRALPVVLVNVDAGATGRTEQAPRLAHRPEGWTELLPALNRQPGDHCVTKRSWGASPTPTSKRS